MFPEIIKNFFARLRKSKIESGDNRKLLFVDKEDIIQYNKKKLE